MTVYERRFLGYEDGDPQYAYDELPPALRRVWDDDGQEWRSVHAAGALWTAVGVKDSRILFWRELLAEFGPASDEPPTPWRCPICGPDGEGCAGHTRTAETALAPVGGGAA